MKELRRENRLLPCKLNPKEMAQKGQELAQTVQEIANEELRQKSIKDQLKARLSELQGRLSKLSLVVTQGEEYRDVLVIDYLEDDGTVSEIRQDVIETIINRPLKEGERQLLLPEDDGKSKEGEEKSSEVQGKNDPPKKVRRSRGKQGDDTTETEYDNP